MAAVDKASFSPDASWVSAACPVDRSGRSDRLGTIFGCVLVCSKKQEKPLHLLAS